MTRPRGAWCVLGFFFGKFPMKNVLFLQDFGPHKAGEHVMAEDQVACDAIASGAAVPSVQAVPVRAPVATKAEAK